MSEPLDLRAILLDLGVAGDEVDQAATDGTLELLALERVMLGDGGLLDVVEVAALTGVPLDQVRAYWRALGFPDPHPGEKLFSELDVELLRALGSFIDEGLLEPGLALQMARVIGSAMTKIANAQVESTQLRPQQGEADRPPAGAARRGVEMLSVMPRVMEFVWRRHLAAAARRRIMRVTGGEGSKGVLVGFADLVGFTARTQQLAEDDLAEVVGRFEEVAFDLVATHGGRVVKMIGDEVMFIHEDVRAGAELGIGLAARFRDDPVLSDVRVGLASGPVLERDGDVYGHVVNLANRLVAFAYPASVVVSAEVRQALEGDPRFVLRALGSHELKDIGSVPISVVRPVAPADGGSAEHGFARAQAKRLHPDG
jgi:adenylate cyclase